jgi:hypothetical protein
MMLMAGEEFAGEGKMTTACGRVVGCEWVGPSLGISGVVGLAWGKAALGPAALR